MILIPAHVRAGGFFQPDKPAVWQHHRILHQRNLCLHVCWVCVCVCVHVCVHVSVCVCVCVPPVRNLRLYVCWVSASIHTCISAGSVPPYLFVYRRLCPMQTPPPPSLSRLLSACVCTCACAMQPLSITLSACVCLCVCPRLCTFVYTYLITLVFQESIFQDRAWVLPFHHLFFSFLPSLPSPI
jgi:hypothetical protein